MNPTNEQLAELTEATQGVPAKVYEQLLIKVTGGRTRLTSAEANRMIDLLNERADLETAVAPSAVEASPDAFAVGAPDDDYEGRAVKAALDALAPGWESPRSKAEWEALANRVRLTDVDGHDEEQAAQWLERRARVEALKRGDFS